MSEKSKQKSTESRILELEQELKTLKLAKAEKQPVGLSLIEENLFDSVPEGLTIVDERGRVIFTNKVAVLQHGYSKEEVIGASSAIFFKEINDAKAFKRLLDKTYKSGSGNSSEYVILRKNGEEVCFSLNLSLKKSAYNDSTQLIVLHKNITKQKKTDLALHESEEKFRSLVENSPDIIMNVDRDGNILFMNHTVTEFPTKNIVGNKVYDYTLPEYRDVILKEVTYTFETGKEGNYEICNIGSDNVLRWFSTRTAPIKKNGVVTAVTLDCRDITEKRAVSKELRQSEELLRRILGSTSGLLNVLDKDFNIMFSNWNEFIELDGQHQKEYLKCHKVFCDNDTPCENCLVQKVFETSEPTVKEVFDNEKSEYREVRSSPLFDKSGAVKYVIEHSVDITEQKESEEKLIQARIKAEEANRMKSEFLANVSHELRTPMNGILGFAKLGRERSATVSREKLKDYFSIINESGRRLQGFLNDLLDLSKLDSGRMTYEFQNEKISMITTIVLDEFFSIFKEKKLVAKFNQPDFSDYVSVDVDKIGQVISNLLSNAVKHADSDSIIRIEINDKEENILFSVFSSGTGISENGLDEIFGRSIHRDKSKTGSGATGLSMIISKEIISSHGGKLWVEKSPENEAIFRFEIPKKSDSLS